MIAPSGTYSYDDVQMNSSYRSSISSLVSNNKEEFVEDAQENINPDTGFMLVPATNVARDEDNSVSGDLKVTAGEYYSRGTAHHALDIVSSGYKELGLCPAGHKECDDTILIAPVSGTIDVVKTNNGYEAANWHSGINNPEITITADPPFDGYKINMKHMSSIPSHIVKGYHVKQGEHIGNMCSLGNSDGTHVHVEVRYVSGAKVALKDWIPMLQLHKSVQSIYTEITNLNRLGFDPNLLVSLTNKDRYNGDALMSQEYKIN